MAIQILSQIEQFSILSLPNHHKFLAKILILLGICKYFLNFLPLLILYLSSTKPLPNLYQTSTNLLPIFYPLCRISALCCNKGSLFCNKGALFCNKGALFCNKRSLLPDKCCLFTLLRLGICSQRGNTLFPVWECHVPNVGISRSQGGNICCQRLTLLSFW